METNSNHISYLILLIMQFSMQIYRDNIALTERSASTLRRRGHDNLATGNCVPMKQHV